MTKKISFSTEQQLQIRLALTDHVKMTDEAAQTSFIADLEEHAELRAFGAGSLLNYSHLQNDNGTFKDDLLLTFGIDPSKAIVIEPARLEGYDKDFVCYDTHYRGTPQAPGITIGLERTQGAATDGGILTTRIDYLGPKFAANFTEYYLQKFAEREMPPNMPIYTFQQLTATTRDGQKVPALACVADQNGPLYIHNPNNQFAQSNPLYYVARGDDQKRAQILASAMGNPVKPDGSIKPKGRVTDLDYLRGVIDAYIEKDVPIDGKFVRLYLMAVECRRGLTAEQRKTLESNEFRGIKGHCPTLASVFANAANLHNLLTDPANDAAPIRAMA
jgi:cation transport regulator ChaC